MAILPNPLRSPAVPAEIVPADFFVLLTPLLPLDEFLAWGKDLAVPQAIEGSPVEALQGARGRLRERLAAVFARPEVEEALRLAAPGLHAALAYWRRDPEGKRGQKVERALVRYFARLCAQPVARGLLGGFSQGQTTGGRETRLRLRERAQYRRHHCLEIEFLCTLAEALSRSPALQEELIYRCNDTLYMGATQVRCAVKGREGGQRSYRLLAAERTDYLVATLERARAGARRQDLVATLVAMDDEIAPEEAAGYVAALVEAQLLVADLGPPVTGTEPHVALGELLGGHAATQAVAAELRAVAVTLGAIDAGGWQAAPGDTEALSRGLIALAAHASLPPSPSSQPWLRGDLVKPGEDLRLGRGPLDEMRRGVELLRRLGPSPSDDGLGRFRDRFVIRYGDEEVPLLAVLDEEAGIGFEAPEASDAGGEPLLAGLQFTSAGMGTEAQGQRFTPRHAFLLEKVCGVLGRGERVMELGDLGSGDFARLAARNPLPLPSAFAVLATLAASSEEALAAGPFQIYLEEVSGPSGARRLGRLSHADRGLAAAVERHLRAEEACRPEAIFAEVVHLPEGGAAGHMVRPLLRGYEIPLLGVSGAPPERQIALADLYVSVLDERVVLRSRRLGREVLPRLTAGGAAGAAARHLGLYRFLCALEQQGVAGALSFDWGPLAVMPFLPRVVSGRLVLARARWRIHGARQRALFARSPAERYQAVQALRAEHALPRHVALMEAGGELLVDLDNALSVESLAERLRHPSGGVATLVEPWPPVEALCTRGPEGRFVHRLIVPFTARSAEGTESTERLLRTTPAVLTVPRLLPPGSDWLGVKIYTGTVGVDEVLREVVAPVVTAAEHSQAIDRWFFVRYVDTAWHLRVRFHGAPEALFGEVRRHLLGALAPLLADGRVHRIELDTYGREIDRYGGSEGILLAECIFHADSQAVLGIVETLSGDEGAQARWQLAVLGITRLLGDLGLGPDDQLTILGELRRDFMSRFQADARLVRQLGQRYRQERPALEALLTAGAPSPTPDETHPLAPGLALLARRSTAIAPVATELHGLAQAGQLTQAVPKLAMSYVHMFANRLLRTSALAQELVIYDFLTRLKERERSRNGTA